MHTHTALLWLHVRRIGRPWVAISALATSLACGSASLGPATQPPPQDATATETPVGPSACEGQLLVEATPHETPAPEDPLRCHELTSAPLVPEPTQATCRALPSAERVACLARLRARARAMGPLGVARAAAAQRDWVAALDGFEAVLEGLPGEPNVLAKLGWARFQAAAWCQETQDRDALADLLDDAGEAPDPIAVLCTQRAIVARAREELAAAVSAAHFVEERAMWLESSARVALAIGEEGEAFEAARQSLCALETPAARRLVGLLLWREGHRAGPEESVTFYQQSILVDPTPEKQELLDNILAERDARFSLSAPSPAETAQFYPNVEALCDVLVQRGLTEPRSPEELAPDLCETGQWEDVAVARGVHPEVHFRVSVMRVRSPDNYNGSEAATYLVAGSRRGLNVMLLLGREFGDSREHNAFVGSIDTELHVRSPDAQLTVSWDAGEADAAGCDWDTAATRYMAFCALLGDVPRCFATANLGRSEYTSDSMLVTVEESLGNCDDFVAPPREPHPSTFRPRYDVTIIHEELVATRASDGAMLCLPLRETLAPLRERAASGP